MPHALEVCNQLESARAPGLNTYMWTEALAEVVGATGRGDGGGGTTVTTAVGEHGGARAQYDLEACAVCRAISAMHTRHRSLGAGCEAADVAHQPHPRHMTDLRGPPRWVGQP